MKTYEIREHPSIENSYINYTCLKKRAGRSIAEAAVCFSTKQRCVPVPATVNALHKDPKRDRLEGKYHMTWEESVVYSTGGNYT